MKIDAHQHFWRYHPTEYAWVDLEKAKLKRDFLPQDLAPLLKENEIDGAVAVQARQSLDETRWLLELAQQHSFIKGVVGWVDLCSPTVEAELEHFAANQKLRGVRHVLQDEVDNTFMLRADFIQGIHALAKYDLAYDILIFPRHLSNTCKLVKQFPNQRFVLDHIAKPLIKMGQLKPWDEDIRRLATFPNVFCKASGMITEADWQLWKPSDFRPYLDVVFDAFGTKRIMFGSDWPVCTLAGTHEQVIGIIADFINTLSAEEQADVWGKTAATFYQF